MKDLIVMIVLLCLLLGSGIGLAFTKHQTRKLYGQLEQLREDRQELQLGWRQLRLEQSHLAALPEVDRKAQQQLGMFIPPPTDVVFIRSLQR